MTIGKSCDDACCATRAFYTLLIVDDHPAVLKGLRFLLAELDDVEIVGEARDAATARDLTARTRPDMILLDLVLGGRDGIDLVEQLGRLHPPTRIIAVSGQEERHFAHRVLRAGGWGYVSKAEPLDVVLAAITAVRAGDIFVGRDVQQALVRQAVGIGAAAGSGSDALSDRELQVLRLLGLGRTTREIAEDLRLSHKTVGTYRDRIKVKLGVDRSSDLQRSAATLLGPVPASP